MNLATFLNDAPRGAAKRLASSLGVHAVMVSQWASLAKRPAAERCAAIEAATGRKVMRWDLRPDDWHLIWPELIGAEGAPTPAPNTTAEALGEV